MILNVTYDASVSGAPPGFLTAVNQAVTFLQNNFSDPVTINIAVGWGEVNGDPLSPGALGENLAFISGYTYAQLKAALTADATSATDASAVASLPATDPTNGGFFWATTGEAKALGLPAASSPVDGYVGFRSTPGTFDFDESDGITAGQYDFFSVFIHEVTEIMGRQMLDGQTVAGQPNSFEPLDLFHFSAAGVRIFTGTQTGYFSADNGVTNLANFNTIVGGDFGDWASSVVKDSFLAFSNPGVINAVSPADMKAMDVLGWTVVPLPDLVVGAPILSATSVSFAVSNTGQAASGASTAGVYLSTTASVHITDTLVGTFATPALATGAADNEVAAFTLPTNLTPGTYYLGVIADQGGTVTEFSETNDASTVTPMILGNSGDNTLTGTSAGNLMIAMAGNDSLNGGSGADTMIGGAGDDTYSVDKSTDVVTENAGEGTDTVLSVVTYVLPVNVENLTLTGTGAINGTGNAGANLITGNSGNNILIGLGGADTLDGGAGLDTASFAGSPAGVNVSLTTGATSGGDAAGDVLIGIENLTGSSGADTLEGDAGNNVLTGGSGVDLLTYEHATAGVSVNLSVATAQATGGAGTDTIATFENLTGTAFGDTLTGTTAANLLTGLAGDDSLTGGTGNDTMVGGQGNDTYAVDSTTDVVTEAAGEGADTVTASATFTLGANIETLTLTGAAAINGTGNADANLITGNSGNNVLAGLGGADTLDGGAGLDTASYLGSPTGVNISLATGLISGGDATGDVFISIENLTGSSFNDTLEGGGGDNVLSGGAGTDLLTYEHATAGVAVNLSLATAQVTGGAGTDTVSLFENLTGTAFGDTLTGTATNNLLTGLAGDDSLAGGAGADTMIGGQGNDTYSVDSTTDVVTEAAGEGADTVTASATFTLGANIETLTLTGSAAIDGTGNADANLITGNSANNVLSGMGGADTLDGGAGLDTAAYAASPGAVNISLATGLISGGDAAGDVFISIEGLTGSAFNDSLEGSAGDNLLSGGAGVDLLTYEHATAGVSVNLSLATAQATGGAGTDTVTLFENLTGTTFGDTLTGSSAANVLTGLAGDDSLNGGAGADTMIGGLGNDSYVVDSTTDVVTEAAGEGADTVTASATFTLGANIETLTLTGAAAITGTGNADANLITGNSGNNVLAGLGGADTLDGGAGLDTASYAASAAAVNVSLATGAVGGGDAAGDVLISIENLTGSALNDTLEGDAGNNVLSGGSGTDLLTYEHASAGVSVNLAVTTAQATGGAGVDTIATFENLTGSAFGDTLTGSSVGNVLTGLAGDDSLTGGAGSDVMIGGAGNDTYVVDKTADVVTENPGEGTDTVQSSVTYTLSANVENLTLTGAVALNGTGNGDANLITGNAASNALNGQAGNDTLVSGGGLDTLTGGLGADRFVFGDATLSGGTISDFNHVQGDVIDLSGVDANSTLAGDQAFTFIGTAAFSNVAGELRFVVSGSSAALSGDTNGDGVADFTLNLTGVTSLVSGDFTL